MAVLIIMAAAAGACLLYVQRHPGFFLPGWIEWEDAEFCDRTGQYKVTLKDKSVCVRYEDAVVWTSPGDIKVQEALTCDIDNDQADELILLCWKRGRYGAHRPFWIEEDEEGWSQHLFVYSYSPDKIRPKWMSSYLGQDIAGLSFNGKSAPDTRLWFCDPQGGMSSWAWDSWGFAREEAKVSFIAFGDLLAHEPIYRYGLQKDPSFGFLFEDVLDMIAESDVAVISQETPYIDDFARYGDYPRFGTPVNIGQAIVDAGFDVVVCATNHALDRGISGIDITKGFFDENGVRCLGIQASTEKEYRPYETLRRNGVCFALLDYTYGTNGIRIPDGHPAMVHLLADESGIREDIAGARAEADIVIVFVHWGTEYGEEPDAFQQEWAQIFLESGVDVVVGTHPHVLQPCEVLTDESGHRMLVYYSIGNFISAQHEKSCVKGGAAAFTVSLTQSGYQVTEYALYPLQITWHEGGKYSAAPIGQ